MDITPHYTCVYFTCRRCSEFDVLVLQVAASVWHSSTEHFVGCYRGTCSTLFPMTSARFPELLLRDCLRMRLCLFFFKWICHSLYPTLLWCTPDCACTSVSKSSMNRTLPAQSWLACPSSRVWAACTALTLRREQYLFRCSVHVGLSTCFINILVLFFSHL